MPNSPLLTTREAADFLRVSRSSLYQAIARGEIRGIRVGRRRLFSQAELDRYIERLEGEEAGFVTAAAY